MNERNNPPVLVNWAGYLAITFLLLLPVSVFTVRSGASTNRCMTAKLNMLVRFERIAQTNTPTL